MLSTSAFIDTDKIIKFAETKIFSLLHQIPLENPVHADIQVELAEDGPQRLKKEDLTEDIQICCEGYIGLMIAVELLRR
jgi:hypothetical protein